MKKLLTLVFIRIKSLLILLCGANDKRVEKKIYLGGGNFSKEGWCNLDLICNYDIGLMAMRDFHPSSADLIFSSHFIEHIPPQKVQVLLKNAFKILKTGGVLRISGPDLDIMTREVLQGKSSFLSFVSSFYPVSKMQCSWKQWYLFVCGNPTTFGRPNKHPSTQHCWMVNANSIVYFLLAGGFSPEKIRIASFGDSIVSELRGSEFDNRKEISFFVEAVK